MCNFVSEIFPSIHWCPFPNGMQLGSFQRSITFPYWRRQPKDFDRLSFSLQRRLIGSRLVSWTWESLFSAPSNCFCNWQTRELFQGNKLLTFDIHWHPLTQLLWETCWGAALGGWLYQPFALVRVWGAVLLFASEALCVKNLMLTNVGNIQINQIDACPMFVCMCVCVCVCNI